MDKRKKFKRPEKHRASIDGIVPSRGGLGAPVSRTNRPKDQQAGQSLGSLIDGKDGFIRSRPGPYKLGETIEDAETEKLLDEPIVLDDIGETAPTKKRLLLGRHRHPQSRHKKLLKRAAITLASLIILVGAFFGIKLYLTEKHLFRGGGGAPALAENIDISKLRGEGDGRINILLLGIGGPGHDGPDLTDTMLLISIDPINHNTALLSIPRDLWVKIPGDGYQKINAAYAYGKSQSKSKNLVGQEQDGLKLLDKTIAPIIGVPIHYHAIVDFAAFKQAVDAVGGVSFNVPTELYDPTIAWENNYNPVIAKPGYQTFNGQKALLYAKSRETSSDFARAQRQRQLIVALKDKVFSLGTFSNPVKVSQLLSSLGSNVYTDFSLSDIMRLYQIVHQIPSSSISSLDLVTPPHDLLTTGTMDGLSIVEPKAGLFQYDALENYIRNALRDGFIAKENANVSVYNATNTVGLATKEANTLKSFGYNVTTVDNTPTATNPPTTKLIDLTKGVDKYTKHYLEERFGVTALTTIPAGSGINPPSGTSFVIILGNNATNSSQN